MAAVSDPKWDNYNFPATNPTAPSGHPGHTDATQDAKVFQLRTMLEAEGCTERLDRNTMVCLNNLAGTF